MSEVKSCPFCGSKKIRSDLEAPSPYGTSSHCSNYVFCRNCGMGVDFSRGAGDYKIQGARELWNTRTPDVDTLSLQRIEEVIDAYKVDEVMTIDIKTVSDIKEFFNQHLETLKQALKNYKRGVE
ncbi:MAG TPA: Lar family restriction alleviation protein [Candidatus Obscuribacterales bacterium]